VNASAFPIQAEIRDGAATATGASCGTNAFLDEHVYQPREEKVFECAGHEGFCYRWKLLGWSPNGSEQYGDWIGVSCVGGKAFWDAKNEKRVTF
jgi:hypothetical protein